MEPPEDIFASMSRLPDGTPIELVNLLGRISERMSTYSADQQDLREMLFGIMETLTRQNVTMATQSEQLAQLKTAITLKNIGEGFKWMAPIVAVISALIVAAEWIAKHMRWSDH